MAKVIRTEEEILEDLKKYVASRKRNRPSVLAPIKRTERTKAICEYVFSNPDTFKLENEIKHVPMDVLTEDMLIKLILDNPNNIKLLDEEMISTPVMVAFEYAKRRYEHLSAMEFGCYGLKYEYPKKIYEVRDSVESLCDELPVKFDDHYLLSYVKEVSKIISEFFKTREVVELEKTGKVNIKYSHVDINTKRKVLVLISGEPDSGKTTFGKYLGYRINNSVVFDSDELAERGRELEPLHKLVKDSTHVVIFSDPNAEHYFSEEDTKDYDIVNIVVIPSSVEKMYRNSKMKQHIPYDEYVKIEANNPYHNEIYRDITITNTYDVRLWEEVDKALEDMSILLDFKLPELPNEDNKKLEKK